jgi:flagellar FliL protein
MKQQPAPAKSAPSPAAPGAAVPGGRHIPSVVPLNGRDAAYAAGHPGWERYESSTLEFLVFKEQGTVKALQVIGKGGESVPEQTIAAVLRESFQSERYTVKGSTEKDGFLLEEGIVPGKGEILIYRKKGPGTVRALVVTWP